MNIKKIISTSAICLVLHSSVSFASSSEVKLKGAFDFQAFSLESSGNALQKRSSANKNGLGLYSSTDIYLDYALVSDSGLKYGGKVGLELTTKNSRGVPASVYIESDYGKFEGGSDKSAGKKMKITGYTASCGSAGMWDTHIKASPDKKNLAYVTNFCSFLDSKMRTSGKVEYSRKITYITPKFNIGESNTLQLGISYVPDSSNMGNVDVDEGRLHTPVGASKFKFAIKDGISYAASHNVDFSEKTSLKTSFVGESGKAIGFAEVKDSDNNKSYKRSNVKFKNLNNYVIGSEFKYDDISFSASYGNYNKSLSSKDVDKIGRDTYLYSVGGKYTWNKFGFSLTQFHSNHKKNKLDASTFGVDYNVTKGVKSYLQTTYYQTNGKYLTDDNKLIFDKSHGTLVIVGTKLSF